MKSKNAEENDRLRRANAGSVYSPAVIELLLKDFEEQGDDDDDYHINRKRSLAAFLARALNKYTSEGS